MYCKNCGTLIGTEDDFCLECKSKINKRKKSSLFLAILSQALYPIVGILLYVSVGFVLFAFASLNETLVNIFILCLILALVLVIASLVLGLISIINYAKSKKSGVKLPTAVFVLGLISTIDSALIMFYFFISFIYTFFLI